MRSILVPALLLLAACSTHRGLDPSRLTASDEVELEKEIQADLNDDQIDDTVKLLPPKEKSDFQVLQIVFFNRKKFETLENKNLVSALASPGASLELLDNGSFKILIDHSGAGRSASLREYTISFLQDKFILSGITVSEYDRIDPNLGGSCDLNLLTGEGERNSKAIKIQKQNIDLKSLSFDWLPSECKF